MTNQFPCPFGSLRECVETFRAIDVLQYVAGRAWFKYEVDVGQTLRTLVKEYDRLDDETERSRLHAWVQQQ